MSRVSNKYELIEPKGKSKETLGEGAYGVVYKAKLLGSNGSQMFALKKIKVESENEGISSSALREITLLNQLDHENVIKLVDVEMIPDRLNLIFDLMEYDLKKDMDAQKHIPMRLSVLKSYTAQIMEGLAYIHSMGIMHRDLKPHNILLDRHGTLKIADFGLARTYDPTARTLTIEVVTRWYRSPEILLGYAQYDSGVDMWSMGCIIAEMSNKLALFQGDSDIDQIHKIFRTLGTPHPVSHAWPELASMPYYRNSYPQWKTPGFIPANSSVSNHRDGIVNLVSADNTPVASSSSSSSAIGGQLMSSAAVENAYWQRMFPRMDADGVDLLKKLLTYNPQRRMSAKDALLHPFIATSRAAKWQAIASAPPLVVPGTPVNTSCAGMSSNAMSGAFAPPAMFATPPPNTAYVSQPQHFGANQVSTGSSIDSVGSSSTSFHPVQSSSSFQIQPQGRRQSERPLPIVPTRGRTLSDGIACRADVDEEEPQESEEVLTQVQFSQQEHQINKSDSASNVSNEAAPSGLSRSKSYHDSMGLPAAMSAPVVYATVTEETAGCLTSEENNVEDELAPEEDEAMLLLSQNSADVSFEIESHNLRREDNNEAECNEEQDEEQDVEENKSIEHSRGDELYFQPILELSQSPSHMLEHIALRDDEHSNEMMNPFSDASNASGSTHMMNDHGHLEHGESASLDLLVGFESSESMSCLKDDEADEAELTTGCSELKNSSSSSQHDNSFFSKVKSSPSLYAGVNTQHVQETTTSGPSTTSNAVDEAVVDQTIARSISTEDANDLHSLLFDTSPQVIKDNDITSNPAADVEFIAPVVVSRSAKKKRKFNAVDVVYASAPLATIATTPIIAMGVGEPLPVQAVTTEESPLVFDNETYQNTALNRNHLLDGIVGVEEDDVRHPSVAQSTKKGAASGKKGQSAKKGGAKKQSAVSGAQENADSIPVAQPPTVDCLAVMSSPEARAQASFITPESAVFSARSSRYKSKATAVPAEAVVAPTALENQESSSTVSVDVAPIEVVVETAAAVEITPDSEALQMTEHSHLPDIRQPDFDTAPSPDAEESQQSNKRKQSGGSSKKDNKKGKKGTTSAVEIAAPLEDSESATAEAADVLAAPVSAPLVTLKKSPVRVLGPDKRMLADYIASQQVSASRDGAVPVVVTEGRVSRRSTAAAATAPEVRSLSVVSPPTETGSSLRKRSIAVETFAAEALDTRTTRPRRK